MSRGRFLLLGYFHLVFRNLHQKKTKIKLIGLCLCLFFYFKKINFYFIFFFTLIFFLYFQIILMYCVKNNLKKIKNIILIYF